MALERLLRPHSVAVVGASPRTFVGTVVLENLRRLGFTGSVFPVSRHPEVAGYPAYPSLSDVPASVDIAVVQVQTSRVLSIVREGISAAIKSFVIPGAGFTDSGEAALRLVSDLQQLRQQCEFELVGPNCMGVLDLVSGAAPYIGTVTEHVRGGNVALVAQSGAVIEAIVNCGGRVPLSTAVSTGSESITGIADYIRFFVSDPHTNALLVFIETLNDPVALTESVRSMADAGKPVAVCVVGHSQTANEGIAAHSGRLAVGARLVSTALEQAGAIVAADLDELLALGELLGTQRSYPGGTRMHVVTNSGGEGNLVADLADQVGLDLPKVGERVRSALASSWPALTVRNPLDPWGADDYEQIYPQALRQVAGEPGDIVMVAMDQHAASGEHERRLGRDLANYLGQAVDGTGKYPVLLSPLSDDVDPELVQACRRSEVPLLRGARPGMAALASLARWTARPRNGAPKFDPECERRMSGLDVTGIVNEVQALDC